MSTHAYTENQLVEQPAIGLFAELGWEAVSATEEKFGVGGTLGRETSGEVVLGPRLRAALERLNPELPPEAITAAVDELIRDRSAMLLEQANREVYRLLKDGIAVSVLTSEAPPSPRPSPSGKGWPEGSDEGRGGCLTPRGGGQTTVRVRVIDWEDPTKNDFLLVSQFSVTGALYTCRPDLVGFVNGLPLVVIELKKPGVPARAAFIDNLTSYKHPQNGIPALFVFNALLIASNGTESRVGSLTADWERWVEWKRIEREDEPRRVSLEVMLRGTCDKVRLLDLVENFTLFSEHKAGLVKILGQNHQVLGVNNAMASMIEARSQGHGRGGVFWQTQGSGKSFSMVFFAQKVLRRLAGNWTFVVVTDRVELDDQIAKTFAACGAVNDTAESHASSGAHLRELLRGNQRYVFTLIQKFQTPEILCDRSDVIVLTDEAHRSQYDTLALNMRSALPKALFLAFTGTPLISGEERTKEVFGDYVSIYDFQQSVEDGATVPLFYENRTPELQLVNPDLNEDIYNLIETAELDQDQETKLERELSKQYHILTRDDRLETVAQDIVRHFLGRGFQGKAMVVSIDKATALKMHDKVKRILGEEREREKQSLTDLNAYPAKPRGSAPPPAEGGPIRELLDQLRRIEKVDQALIVSPAQNEVETMKKHGLDIVPHRRRMNESQPPLDEKFKDPEDPLSLVFVCAMWLTGFDAPSCSTIYLDKPMRNHTLMQTIARANRVYPGKHSGTIVDYANVFVSLEKALAIYGAGQGGTNPVQDKATLVESLKKAVANATEFCSGQGVDLSAIEDAPSGDMGRLGLLGDAVNALISPDPLRREFLAHERIVGILYRAVKPSPAALEFSTRVNCLQSIADAIRAQTSPGTPDISGIMGRINELLDDSIEGVEMAEKPVPVLDLSKIDFAALSKRFKQSKHRNIELEALKVSVQAMLDRLIAMNRTRMDFRKKFEELIDAYNAGSTTIEQLYQELLNLSRTLTEEQARHVREKLTEEELTVFDLLTRPGPELTTEEKEEVKKVSRLLLERLKTVLTLNWRQTIQARARIRDAIEATLDEGLPRTYTPAVYKTKCGTLFEHVFERFPDEGGGGKIGKVA